MPKFIFNSRFLLVFGCIFFISKSFAQTGWNWLNPKPQGNTLHDVAMPGPQVIVGVGDAGAILRSNDGGQNWKLQRSRTNLAIRALSFVHPDTGFAVGDSGIVLKTVNGGLAWFRQPIGTNRQLTGVHFLSGNLGFCVGASGLILKTTNGGKAWTPQSSNVNTQLYGVHFQNETNGWAVGEGGNILVTVNGGLNWSIQTSNVSTLLRKALFLNPNVGYVVGANGTILKTTNAGSNWQQQVSNSASQLNSISVYPPDTVFVSGGNLSEPALLLKTTDGGQTWLESNAFPEFTLFGIAHAAGSVAFGMGQDGYIFKSDDKFESGQNLKTGYLADFAASAFLSIDSGFVMGSSGSTFLGLHTTDGGQSWLELTLGTSFSKPYDLKFINATTAFMCGTSGKIIKTTNRGNSWTEPTATGTTNTIRSLSFSDQTTGTAVGQSGTILRTTDGGNSWTPQTGASPLYQFNVHMVTNLVGFAAGENGIQATTNGGTNWTQQYSQQLMYDVHFFDAQNGISVGPNGKLIKTTNGGNLWTDQILNSSKTLYSIHFSSQLNGIIAGDSGVVFRTVDGGQNWIRQISYNNVFINKALVVNDTVAYIVGDKGAILKTTTGGSTCPDALFNYTGVFLPGKFCEDDTLTQSLYFDGTPGGTFSATPPGLDINATTGIIKPWQSIHGNYTVQYQVTPPNGCPTQTFQTNARIQERVFIPKAKLEIRRPPYALPPQTVFVPCQGDTLLTRARNQFANLGFAWYRNNALLRDTMQEIKVSQSGLYAVKYRDQACAGPFYDTVQIDFEDARQPLRPNLVLTSPPVSCNDDFTLTSPVGLGITYEWVDEFGALIPGQTGNTLNISRVGTYRIQIDSLGCKNLSDPIIILPVGADTVLPTLYTINTKGTDVLTEKNEVRWNRQTYDTSEVKRVVVYRAADSDAFYSPIAEIPANDSLFIDPTAIPGNGGYSYKISAKQLCGNELFFSPSSDLQNSIFLDLANHPSNNYVLRWSEPEGYKVRKYRILRGLTYDNLNVLVDSLSGQTTSFVDIPPTTDAYFYRVEAETNQDYSPWGRIQAAIRKSASNTKNTTYSYCDSCYTFRFQNRETRKPYCLFPNPSNGNINFSGFVPDLPLEIQIITVFGQAVMLYNGIPVGNNLCLEIKQKGMFSFLIRQNDQVETIRILIQ